MKVLVKQISLICFRAYLEVYVAKNPTCFSRWSFRCAAYKGEGNNFDNTCYNFYNMFETKEAAETARDNIKMTLQYCQLLLLPVVKDIPDKACIKTDYLIGTGLTSEVKAKLKELIKVGF